MSLRKCNLESVSNLSKDDKPDTTQDMKITNIIERIKFQLKLDAGQVIAPILETLLKIGDCAEKRDLKYELLNNYIRCLQESDAKEVNRVSTATRSLFISEKLKKLLVDDNSLQEDKKIGQGGFGTVTLGYLKQPAGTKLKVAIKKISPALKYNLINEAEIMVHLDHENIVKVVAFQLSRNSKLVMEFMGLGDLTRCIPEHKFSDEHMLQFIFEIASGMEYMTAKKYVHCDLACQNVFVDSSLHCKIGDFGVSRYVGDSDGVYEMEDDEYRNFNIPPEARLPAIQKFSWKTDVWAMGVLIWEMFCLQEICGIVTRHFFLASIALNLDVVLPKAERCPTTLYYYSTTKIMNADPDKRPTFTMIKNKISEMM